MAVMEKQANPGSDAMQNEQAIATMTLRILRTSITPLLVTLGVLLLTVAILAAGWFNSNKRQMDTIDRLTNQIIQMQEQSNE